MHADRLDILCFGAHPDDVEIGMAGTVAKHAQSGLKVGIVDLTQAELSSNGTVSGRQEEAEYAARILGVHKRINLGFPDRGLTLNDDTVGEIVRIIRRYRPEVVFLPYDEDRHPDHRQTARIVEEAVFSANIRKYRQGEEGLAAHQVSRTYFYFFNEIQQPDVVVDISAHVQVKQRALQAYSSQFQAASAEVKTRLNTGFLEVIEGRDRLFGKWANVDYAEGFKLKHPLLLEQLSPAERSIK